MQINRLPVLVFATALAGGCGGEPTRPTPVSAVIVSPGSGAILVGITAQLTAQPRDIGGNPLSGRSVAWSSSNSAVATVSPTGLVTGVSAGLATVTATIETVTGTATITVVGGASECATRPPLTLAVGEVKVLSGDERTQICLPGGAAGTEYALIAINAAQTRVSASVGFTSSNTAGPTGMLLAPSALIDPTPTAPSAAPGAITGLVQIAGRMPRNLDFERSLRRQEREMRSEMRNLMRAAARTGSAPPPTPRSVVRSPGGIRSIRDLPATPATGTLITLNASSTSACTTPLLRTGRVRAVTTSAIVVEDTLAPTGGFSDGEYLSIATTFDTLVFPLDTTTFGAPFDKDRNGRILLFFTTAVNQRTAPGSASVVGGFFWERDLWPRDSFPGFACATSNEGEMFYLPVVDAGSTMNSYFTNKTAMLLDINSTTIHEFQHLINSSRRIYVTPEIVEEEEPWLNEAMSHLAEELLYFRVAGLQPKADLGFSTSTGGSTNHPRYTALVSYQIDNLSRYSSHLAAVETTGSFTANDDGLATRGAAWALLRWGLDHSSGTQESYLRALVNAPTQGIPNFNNVFAGVGGLAGAVRGAVVANYTDNLTSGMHQTYSHLSWNFRDWLPHFTVNSGRYPLITRALVENVPVQATLSAGGGSSIARFRVNAGTSGGVTITVGGSAPAASVDLVLVRSQ